MQLRACSLVHVSNVSALEFVFESSSRGVALFESIECRMSNSNCGGVPHARADGGSTLGPCCASPVA